MPRSRSAAAFATPLALAALLLGPPPAAAAPTHGKVCFTTAEEDELHKLERMQLGDRHAADHAKSRKAKCEAQQGLRRVPDKENNGRRGEDALKEERDTRAAILARLPKPKADCNAANWNPGTFYVAGGLVSHGGQQYVARVDNQGQVPAGSPNFWAPQAC